MAKFEQEEDACASHQDGPSQRLSPVAAEVNVIHVPQIYLLRTICWVWRTVLPRKGLITRKRPNEKKKMVACQHSRPAGAVSISNVIRNVSRHHAN